MSKNAKNSDTAVVKGGGIKKYFRDLFSDFKKITWPSRQELFNNLIVVIVLMLAVMVFVGASDSVFLFLYNLLLGNKK